MYQNALKLRTKNVFLSPSEENVKKCGMSGPPVIGLGKMPVYSPYCSAVKGFIHYCGLAGGRLAVASIVDGSARPCAILDVMRVYRVDIDYDGCRCPGVTYVHGRPTPLSRHSSEPWLSLSFSPSSVGAQSGGRV